MGPSLFTYKVSNEHAEEMRARARAIGRVSNRREAGAGESAVARRAGFAIRITDGSDRAVEHLAALDGMPVPAGSVLLAEVDGVARAALPLEMDWAIADPFFPTADLVQVLRLRAAQLRGVEDDARRARSLLERMHLAHAPRTRAAL